MSKMQPQGQRINAIKRIPKDEFEKYIQEKGEDLTDEELDSIAGGWENTESKCKDGKEHDYKIVGKENGGATLGVVPLYRCSKCGDEYLGM